MDLSQSSGVLISNNGTIVLTVKNTSGVVVASNVFNWYSSGSILYPSNPISMNNWLNLQQVQNDYEVGFGVTGIVTTGSVGTNTLVAEFIHGGDFIGVSSGFYLNNADLNGF